MFSHFRKFVLAGALSAAALSLPEGAAQAGAVWPELSASVSGTKKPPALGANDAALLVGIEEYAFVSKIGGAVQNASDWWSYLREGRGLDRKSLALLRNREATREKMLAEARRVASAVKPGGTLWFVFIGHGVASKDGEEGLLVGMDAQGEADSLDARSVRQSELETIFRASKAARVVMLVDSCFSGKTPSGQELAHGLQALVRKSELKPTNRLIKMTAGRADQFAGPLPGAARPAFSYLILGALRGWGDANEDGKVTAQEAVNYADEVLTALVKDRRQTPELIAFGADRDISLSDSALEAGPDIDAMILGGTAGTSAAGDLTAAEKAVAEKRQREAEAAYQEALKFDKGEGVPKDRAKALAFFKQAAEKGHLKATHAVGVGYFNGRKGVAKDQTEAAMWWRRAADRGYAKSQDALGLCYKNGYGVTKDEAKGCQWFEKAAEQRSRDALFNLGVCYFEGQGREKDEAKGLALFQEAFEMGSEEAAFNLGIAYNNGRGTAQDVAKGLRIWTDAAERGNVQAQAGLGAVYYNGKLSGRFAQKPDPAKAAYWLEKSWNGGNILTSGLLLGFMLVQGAPGVPADVKKGVDIMEKVAASEVKPTRRENDSQQSGAIASSQALLAAIYCEGKVQPIQQDNAKCRRFLERAAELGQEDAQRFLGLAYLGGEVGFPRDREKAVYWLKKAADQGNEQAKADLKKALGEK